MNRAERRKIGYTESRYRKLDLGRRVRWYDDAFVSHSFNDAMRLGNTVAKRTSRLDGEPRRWQIEKGRRRLEALDANV